MSAGRKLNVLLARERKSPEMWPETVACLLKPLGIATFEASSGPDALELSQLHRLHLLVVDTDLPYRPEITLWRLIQRLQTQWPAESPGGMQRSSDATHAMPPDAIRGARGALNDGPPVILLSAQRTDAVLREALRCNVFSVLPQPTDWQTLLDAMARALNRYTRGRWPDGPGGAENNN